MPPRLPRREKHLGQPPCRTHRPSPAAKTIRQQRAPVPKRAPPPIRAGGAFPVCPFRSFLQHEPQRAIARTAPHDRQNNSARPSARHIAAQSPVSHTPRHAAPPAAPRKTLGPAVMPGAPPRHENSPVSRTPHAAPPSPRPSHFRAQSGQPHKNWAAPDRTHRPSPAVKTIRQQRSRPKARPPPVRAGGAFPFVRFVPSSENGRSAQSQRQAPHDRQNNSAIRHGPQRRAHGKRRTSQEPQRASARTAALSSAPPAPVQSAASSSALGS